MDAPPEHALDGPSVQDLAELYAVERNGAAPHPDANAFALLGFDELRALPDLAFLIDDLVPLDGMSVIFGAPASFKSFVALDWALCVATGLPWFGHAVKPGWVVYVAAEGRGGLKRRVMAWWEARGRPDMSRARFLPEAVNLLDRGQVARARSTLAGLPERPRLLTIDTMARSMLGGDENAARDVGMFIAAVDGLRAADAALVVHHAGKAGRDERGSSALRGAADLMVRTERDGGSPRLRLVCDKAKDFEEWEALTLVRELVADSCVLSRVEDAAARGELRDRVLAYVAEHEPVSGNVIEKALGGRHAEVREAIRALDRNNRIRRAGDGWVQVRPETGANRDEPRLGQPAVVRPGGGDRDVVPPPTGEPRAPVRPGSPDAVGRTPSLPAVRPGAEVA